MSKVVLNKILAEGANPLIHQLAFDNSSQPHILKTSKDGKILFANTAACKLLGYSKKQLLAKSRSDIFDVSELSFKKILKERISLGKSSGNVVMIKKAANVFPVQLLLPFLLETMALKPPSPPLQICGSRSGIKKG